MQLVRRGFTLAELSLSIAFISVLSIIVVVLINNAVSAYHKGLTLNQINTTGMDLVDDMRVAIQSSPATSILDECQSSYHAKDAAEVVNNCIRDNAKSFIIMKRKMKVTVGGESATDVPAYGVFCTGAYSYLWNSGYFFNNDDFHREGTVVNQLSLKYKLKNDTNDKEELDFRLLKVKDDERAVCKGAAGLYDGSPTYREADANGYSDFSNTIDIRSQALDATPEDLLTGTSSLAIFDLTTTLPAENGLSNSMFYAMSFILATVQGGININTNGNFCAAPEDFDRSDVESFDYCAINKFNFAATAAGEKS